MAVDETNDFWPEKLQDDIGYGIEEEFHFLEKKKLFYNCGIVNGKISYVSHQV